MGKSQEDSLVVQLALPGVPKDDKDNPKYNCFEVYVTRSWRGQYDDVFARMAKHGSRGRRGAPAPKLVKAAKKLNRFLKAFIDQTDLNHAREYRDSSLLHRAI